MHTGYRRVYLYIICIIYVIYIMHVYRRTSYIVGIDLKYVLKNYVIWSMLFLKGPSKNATPKPEPVAHASLNYLYNYIVKKILEISE